MRNAFSLVELSIVLVILGLLVGGILTGQSLIRAAELRSVTTDIGKYQTVMMTFRDKYLALPGDMPNATDFWGSLDAGDGIGSDCYTASVPDGTKTCNGTGDGQVHNVEGGSGQYWNYAERFLFWQHLANAGLIEGQYTGQTDSSSDNHVLTAGKNVPAGKISGTYFGVSHFLNYTFEPVCCYGDVVLGHLVAHFFSSSDNGPLIPEEAWNIDKKMDDGKPGKGRLGVRRVGAGFACATTDDASTAEYDLSVQDKECIIDAVLY